MKKIWLLILWLCSLFFLWNFTQAKDYEYTNLDIIADVRNDWTIRINEYFAANFFVSKHGIIRDIPLNYSVEWNNFNIQVSNIKVIGKNFSTNTQNWNIEIKIWDANKTVIWEQNYDIFYTTYGLIRNFSWLWYAELYWNLVWYDFDTNIKKVKAVIKLPKEYTGFTSDDFLITTDWKSNTVEEFQWVVDWSQWDKIIITYDQWLSAYHWITLAIKFPNNYFKFDHNRQESLISNPNEESSSHKKIILKSIIDDIIDFFSLLFSPILLIIIFVFLLCPSFTIRIILCGLVFLFNIIAHKIKKIKTQIVRKKGGRLRWKLAKEFPIVVQYTPPQNISSAEASLLIHRHAEPISIISLIYKWASEWLILIKTNQKDDTLWDNKKLNDVIIEKLWEISESAPDYEKKLFKSISTKNGISEKLLSLRIESAKLNLEEYWKKKKWFTSRNIKPYLKGLSVFLFLMILFSIYLFVKRWQFIPWVFILLIVVWFASAIYCTNNDTYNKLTKSWAKILSHVLWYREFLLRCDENKLRSFLKEDPLFIDKILPYATIFGLDSELIKKITPIMKELKIETKRYDSDLNSMNNFSSSLHKYESPSTSSSWKKTLSSKWWY